MLNVLYQIESELHHHLENMENWKSIYVDYHKPYVKRLWKQHGDYRIYLHQIFSCEKIESLLHPHPWPSAMKVIEGKYEMGVGYSHMQTCEVIASTLILPEGSYYEMCDINSWHYVRPLNESSFSLMVTGIPWKRQSPKSSYPLRELNQDEKNMIFSKFINKYSRK